MSRRTNESARLWILAFVFFVTIGLIGWSFGKTLSDLNADTAYYLELDIPSKASVSNH